MHYLMIVRFDDEARLTPEDAAQMGPATEAWVGELDTRGVRLEGHQLRPPSDATTLRRRDGALVVTDGPFAETKEQIAGYDLLVCDDHAEAVEAAAAHPIARWGALELRPFHEDVAAGEDLR